MHQLILVAVSAVFATGLPDAPDLILANGKIFLADPSRRWAEALAIRGERITAAGSSREVLALAGPGTRTIDLRGRTVIPGINDAHQHQGSNPTDAVFLE